MKNTLTYRSLVAYIISVVPEIKTRGWDYLNDEECMDKIMLDDVLIALEKSILSLGAVACVTSQGRFLLKMPNGNFENGDGAFKDWHLGKPLSGQDKRTIIWLKSIFPIAK